MSYQPSLKDFQTTNQNQGYQPSLKDFDVNPVEEKSPIPMSHKYADAKSIYEIIKPTNPLSDIRDFVYGFGKAGANIAKTFNPSAPDMPDFRGENPNPLATALGQTVPFAVTAPAGWLGALGSGAAYGATQYEPGQQGFIDKTLGLKPGGRIRNIIEDTLLAGLLHGLIPNINPGSTAINNLGEDTANLWRETPANISQEIANRFHNNISNGNNLEGSSRELSARVNNSYQALQRNHSNAYDQIFNLPLRESYQHGVPSLAVRDMAVPNSQFNARFAGHDFPEENLQLVADRYNHNPNINNAHELQSELGKEIGYLTRQRDKGNLDAIGRNALRRYGNMRDLVLRDIHEGLHNVNPALARNYQQLTQSWRREIVPYHAERELSDMAEGRLRNPTREQVISTFKNPEESINKVARDLGPHASDRIVHLGMGKVDNEVNPQSLLTARNQLERQGLASYINPRHEEHLTAMRNSMEHEADMIARKKMIKSIGKKALTGAAIVGLMHGMQINPNEVVGSYIGSKSSRYLNKK